MDKKKILSTILTTMGVAAATSVATKAVDFAIDKYKEVRAKQPKKDGS